MPFHNQDNISVLDQAREVVTDNWHDDAYETTAERLFGMICDLTRLYMENGGDNLDGTLQALDENLGTHFTYYGAYRSKINGSVTVLEFDTPDQCNKWLTETINFGDNLRRFDYYIGTLEIPNTLSVSGQREMVTEHVTTHVFPTTTD